MIPNLPTDNLYKFLALSGLVIVFLTSYTMFNRMHDIEDQKILVQEEIEVLGAKSKYVVSQIDGLGALIDNSIRRNNSSKEEFTDSEKLIISYSIDEVKELRERVNNLMLERDLDIARLESKNNRSEVLLKRLGRAIFFAIWGSISGLILAVFGFYKWYMLVQKPSDILVARKLKGIESDCDDEFEEGV